MSLLDPRPSPECFSQHAHAFRACCQVWYPNMSHIIVKTRKRQYSEGSAIPHLPLPNGTVPQRSSGSVHHHLKHTPLDTGTPNWTNMILVVSINRGTPI